ncbi:hypothetical protein Q5424_11825 [Conexibacter sp. JD483]|uniref:hypothetical protein n=1 Tax=unclassified Conexibacter TaxID=2627773 RepID=UPI00271C638E|nr:MULTISPECIES: hypothetical protein [unclassified Conexibacter]MDO8187860.1 hypothetical protein [Conexibacter sp. CPCC 205706]MDO8201212.1 hypothetical protein [Conexibacter sp. CPCC 205762]MDR9369776.1 hypothetical protein [Conexibacter sp. JD483]
MERAREEEPTARALRARVGSLPGFPLLLACLTTCLLAGLVLPTAPATAVGLVLPLLLFAYAWCRPTRRGDYAYAVIAPACVSALCHDLIGVPRWAVALPVAVLSLAAVWRFDAERRATLGLTRPYRLPARRPRLAR